MLHFAVIDVSAVAVGDKSDDKVRAFLSVPLKDKTFPCIGTEVSERSSSDTEEDVRILDDTTTMASDAAHSSKTRVSSMTMSEMIERATKKRKQTAGASTAPKVVIDAKPLNVQIPGKNPEDKKVPNVRTSSAKEKQIKEEEYEVRVPVSFLSRDPNAVPLWPTIEKLFFSSTKRLSQFKPPEIVGEAINLQLNAFQDLLAIRGHFISNEKEPGTVKNALIATRGETRTSNEELAKVKRSLDTAQKVLGEKNNEIAGLNTNVNELN
ncbi:uncharacterized protein LOC110714963 isoform X1 [Chenopodium quinoa]|uniref:uncharacterized protein LOC110714963 isoform X1 n=2 Tax=Chenopodium quinoa TaxID=63459 RepID=UPI000B772A75|nr:uncharacterized protein LOC110714963 isoform X1 [Chenopodium quinoa]